MMATFTSKALKELGNNIFFLDSACSPTATVFNCRDLVKMHWNSDKAETTTTLGGGYRAPYSADFSYFGVHDYDDELPMSVISWNWIEQNLKAKVSEPSPTGVRSITFSSNPVVLYVSWVEGVLAGSLDPLVEYHTKCKMLFAQWHGRRTDEPSELLSQFKIVKDMSATEIKRLDAVHRALQTTWGSSETDLVKRIKSGELQGTNFSEKDVRTYFSVFEKDLEALKAREKDKRYYVMRATEYLEQSESVMFCDVFTVSSCKFLVAAELATDFIVVASLLTEKDDELIEAIGECRDFFNSRHCNVVAVEFDRGGPDSSTLMTRKRIRTIPRATHVSVAELNIRIIKERVRGVISLLPYDISKKMMVHLVIGAAMSVNTITRSEGVSAQKKLMGINQNYLYQFALAPGEYCEVHTASNNLVTQPRTVSSIALHPDPSNLAEWIFLSLETGEVFTRHHGNAYPMPFSSQVIDRLNVIASMDPTSKDDSVNIREPRAYDPVYPQPLIRRRGRPKRAHVRGSHLEDIVAEVSVDPSAEVTTITEETNEHVSHVCMTSYHIVPEFTEFSDVLDEPWKVVVSTPQREQATYDVIEDGELLTVSPDGCSLYCHAEENMRYCYATQMSIKSSTDEYGEQRTSESVRKELVGLLDKKAFTVMSKNFIRKGGKKIIPMSLFLTMKRDGTLKARMVAGGHRQDRRFYDVGRTTSPTVSTQSIMSILNIAASERRNLMTLDIRQAYLEADMDEELYMIINKDVAKELAKINKSYANEVCSDGTILVKLDKALYGCIQSSKLWYERITQWMMSKGFQQNQADKCVFNRVNYDGAHQLTVAIYVDDMLVTSKSNADIDEFYREVESDFDISSCEHGDKIEYLGMTIDRSSDEYIEVKMEKYTKEILSSCKVTGISRVPASTTLFDIDDSAPKLDSEQSEWFHSTVASILYMALRTRPDILTAVTFLCSRVAFSTTEDLKKLNKLLFYLNYTSSYGIRLGNINGPIALHVFCDASFAVYQDAKSMGGTFVTGGRGCIYCKCSKLKLVAKSSAEAELITLSDGASIALWTQMFLKYQGYNVKGILYEDNKSAITMMKTGKGSERTRHVNIKYYFVKQYIDNGALALEYCPTASMVADALTKPLQGYQFEYIRDYLLGYRDVSELPN